MLELEVMGIRLAAPEDSPVLLLKHGSKVLPIWISPIDAAAIAVMLDEEPQPVRPMTHDLLSSVLQTLAKESAGSVAITGIEDGIYTAAIRIDGHLFDCRPSDGVAVALRNRWAIECPESLMDEVGVEVDEPSVDEVTKFRAFLDSVNADDFES